MASNPSIVFVVGAWHGPETWKKVTSRLEAQQYKCTAVELPSTLSNPDTTFTDDVNAVRQAIQAETTQGRDVVVVVHSYGGAVGPSAIKGFTRAKQTESSEVDSSSSGHVVGLCMMNTGFIPTGVGFLENFGGKPPPIWRLDEETGFAVITVDRRELFYHDLSKEEGDAWVAKLREQAFKPFMDGTDAYAGWMDVPVWYLLCTVDMALPIEPQRMLVQFAKDAGVDVTTREVAASHSPMLSVPDETASFIKEAVAAFSVKGA